MRLEHVDIGRRMYTSREAICRFGNRLSESRSRAFSGNPVKDEQAEVRSQAAIQRMGLSDCRKYVLDSFKS